MRKKRGTPTVTISQVESGKVIQVWVESGDDRHRMWARVKKSNGQSFSCFAYLDEGATAATVALSQLQLLRDALANSLNVEILSEMVGANSTRKIRSVKISL